MPRQRSVHRCSSCGAESSRWTGRCSACGEWNTLIEEVDAPRIHGHQGSSKVGADVEVLALEDLPADAGAITPTGVVELDRVLGGGIVAGSVSLLGGEPGIGKSTLLLQALAQMARSGKRCLLISAEESPQQVRRRAERLRAVVPGLWLVAETSIPGIRAAVRELHPDVMVVDSIQTVWDPEIESTPGSTVQVRGCAHALACLARSEGVMTVLVGHVTKDGALAGPRALEHLVDTVLSFEGDRHHALRMLRCIKHRFGATGELGLFEMTASGLEDVPDPGGLFLADRRLMTPGSVIYPSMEGQRPLLVEIQALVVRNPHGTPRRSAIGFDSGRLALLLAVLQKRLQLRLHDHDVYVSVVGGVKVSDPGADLAVCLALTSALSGWPVGDKLVVLGEVGLAGEVRQVAHSARRLSEAARLGFRQAVVPDRAPAQRGVKLRRVGSAEEALESHIAPALAALHRSAADAAGPPDWVSPDERWCVPEDEPF